MVAGDQESVRGRLEVGLDRMGMELDSARRDRLIDFLGLLERWNKVYNLTSVRDPTETVSRHLLDSLSVSPYLLGDSVLDVGTGAGLPGIPLAIVAPERSFHLLDSNGKKTRFVRQAAMELGIGNVRVIQSRMESYLQARKFATIVSRAVTSVPDLLAATERLLERPGRLLAMKGLRPADKELRPLEPSPDTLRIHRLVVPFLDAERHLIEASYN
jgi:16S rRNA (guanine527-N7)-methyltransferase